MVWIIMEIPDWMRPPPLLSFIFIACIRHYFPRRGRMVETAAGFTASRDFHPSQVLCELPPLLAAVAGQEYHCVLTVSWQNSPPQAAFRSDGPARHLIWPSLTAGGENQRTKRQMVSCFLHAAAGESTRIFRRRLPRFSRPVREGISTFGYSVFKMRVRKVSLLACIGEEVGVLTTLKIEFSKIFLIL